MPSAQRWAEVVGDDLHAGPECGVQILGSAGPGVDAQLNGDATLDQEQRLAVVSMASLVEHGRHDHEAQLAT